MLINLKSFIKIIYFYWNNIFRESILYPENIPKLCNIPKMSNVTTPTVINDVYGMSQWLINISD